MNTAKYIQSKVFHFGNADEMNQLKYKLAIWNFKEKSVVFTNGCFDLIHLGHIDYLSKAADEADIMIVGLNSDRSVKKIKGEDRPVNDEKSRAAVLASLFFVDAIVIFDEETPFNLIQTITPDVLVKGSDYKVEEIVGNEIVKAKGGRIITIDFLDGYSSSSIIERIRSNR